MNGRRSRSVALAFAAKGHIHCLATDTHDISGRSPKVVKEARAEVEALFGPENLRRLMVDNPRRVLAGRNLECLDGAESAVPAPGRR